ncbi:MAG TPA: sodium:solute symporter [Lentimicrobium sp.]|nr:sodium:solute symporter [Lentimicrobium sp.]
MTPSLLLICFIGYTLLLFLITYLTARKANSDGFFIGNKKSPWFVVAYGMIGASMSGVTFMSVPGWVGTSQFSYFMVVIGYLFGYLVIANILLPLYYRLNLTSIYSYLEQRFGFWSYKTGAFYFLLSRVLGASLRMFLIIYVLQHYIFDAWGIPFWITVAIFISLIILYTFKGGIKTIIWTDTLQTTFMLLALILSIILISQDLDFSFSELVRRVFNSDYSQVLVTDWAPRNNFIKQFLSGIFITIVMTGLDQEMMQKNLSCRNIKDAKKNMVSFSFILVVANFIFLFLGAALYIYASEKGVDLNTIGSTDDVFPTIAIRYLGPIAGLIFFIGLISAAFPSADGALTSLTTSFTIDFLNLPHKEYLTEKDKTRIRYAVHIGFAVVMLSVIIAFRSFYDKALIDKLFTIAGYTYGPLLGLYAFGLFSRQVVKDKWVPLISVFSPLICYFLSMNSFPWWGYKFGFELLILNGLLTYLGLLMITKKKVQAD